MNSFFTKTYRYLLFVSFAFSMVLFGCKKPSNIQNKINEANYKNGMVVSAHPLATEIGLSILKQGGNAYDAAVATQFALAVCYPRAGNIAGGGFMVSRSQDGNIETLDFREKAPKKATETMYLDENGNPIQNLSTQGYLAVGVPGSVAGMYEIHLQKGKLPWAKLIEPAIQLAKNGFVLTEAEANKLNDYQDVFIETNTTEMPFVGQWKKGDKITLKPLAETLTRIRDNGRDGFYKGKTAQFLVEAMQKHNGIISHQDLEEYQPVWRKPIHIQFNELDIYSMAPPSSGGIALGQLLKGIEPYLNEIQQHNSAETVHLYTELERRVYADRATHLGDVDFYQVPISTLLNQDYINQRNSTISLTKATPSAEIKTGNVNTIESIETTHFSIVDKDKNAVAITTTLNGNYGSKAFLAKGGFFLNNEMDDFSIKPGVPNMYGLVGSEANKIEPEKRMLSSMTPTIVTKDNQLKLVVGTPGGSTIITSVFQTILNVFHFKMPIQKAVDAKKVHHQWLPDKILYEKDALDIQTIDHLNRLGHQLKEVNAIGRVDAIYVDENGNLQGGADPRGDDIALGY